MMHNYRQRLQFIILIWPSYTKFIKDIRDSQLFYIKTINSKGELPDVVPIYHHGSIPGDPSWTNAYINLVYWMYHY